MQYTGCSHYTRNPIFTWYYHFTRQHRCSRNVDNSFNKKFSRKRNNILLFTLTAQAPYREIPHICVIYFVAERDSLLELVVFLFAYLEGNCNDQFLCDNVRTRIIPKYIKDTTKDGIKNELKFRSNKTSVFCRNEGRKGNAYIILISARTTVLLYDYYLPSHLI